jgi:N-acetylmuramoyl-L-alanine amidase
LSVVSILERPSPNCGPRRNGLLPGLIVLHHTAMRDSASALDRLCDPAAEVSSHYLIDRDGTVWRLVDEDMRSWHAGTGSWGGAGDVNSRSIGIELDNAGPLEGFPPFPEPQMRSLEAILPGIMTRHGIPAAGVIAHSDMAPERKFDPGAPFDWQRLARAGLSVWPGDLTEGILPDAGRFLSWLVAFGYGVPEGCDDPLAVLLAAFRLRFRAGHAGPLDPLDMAMARDLAVRFAATAQAAPSPRSP